MSHVWSTYHIAVKIIKRNFAKMQNIELISAAELGNVEIIKEFQKHITYCQAWKLLRHMDTPCPVGLGVISRILVIVSALLLHIKHYE